MSCAPKLDLDISLAFRRLFIRSPILSQTLFSVDSTAFFLFWVRLWVRRGQELGSKNKGLADCTSVSKDNPARRSASMKHPIYARNL
jgi:hypothetical protein